MPRLDCRGPAYKPASREAKMSGGKRLLRFLWRELGVLATRDRSVRLVDLAKAFLDLRLLDIGSMRRNRRLLYIAVITCATNAGCSKGEQPARPAQPVPAAPAQPAPPESLPSSPPRDTAKKGRHPADSSQRRLHR